MDEQENIRSTAADDMALESAVLQQVLALHPTILTIDELAREMGEGGGEALERAIRDLAAAGLLHRGEASVRPTRAALRFDELLQG